MNASQSIRIKTWLHVKLFCRFGWHLWTVGVFNWRGPAEVCWYCGKERY